MAWIAMFVSVSAGSLPWVTASRKMDSIWDKHSARFSCSNTNFSIADGSSQTVWIKFSPRHNVYHNSELVIENDAFRGTVSVDLTGQGRYSKTYYNASENLEEEASIQKIYCLRELLFKKIIFIALTIFTCGIINLLCK